MLDRVWRYGERSRRIQVAGEVFSVTRENGKARPWHGSRNGAPWLAMSVEPVTLAQAFQIIRSAIGVILAKQFAGIEDEAR
jgi:hypothetical protein